MKRRKREGRGCSFRLTRLPLSSKGAGSQEQLLLTWTNTHHSRTWGILAALTWDHSSRIKVAASPAGDYPAMMRSSGSAELPAQLEQESKGQLAITVCDIAWHCSASLGAKGFWITDPSGFQTRYWAPTSAIMLLLLSLNLGRTSI